jgi:hypothetical protein
VGLLAEGGKMYLRHAFLPVLLFSPVIIILPTLHVYLAPTLDNRVIVDSIVKKGHLKGRFWGFVVHVRKK